MITSFKAQNFACLKNVAVDLTPVHAFIGPNDSGKSTLLHAVRTVCQLAGPGFADGPDAMPLPFDPWAPWAEGTLLSAMGRGWQYSVEAGPAELARRKELRETVRSPGGTFQHENRALMGPSVVLAKPELAAVLTELSGVRLLRLDADALRRPSGLIPADQLDSLGFLDDRGDGLPSVLYGVRERDHEAFTALVDAMRAFFPTLKTLRLPAATPSTLTLEIELADGTRVRPDRMSEGLLRFLALNTLQFLAPCSVVLVEEPENGLHPARVAEVVHALRAFSSATNTQVLIATHSPLVIDELGSDEVTVLIRPSAEEGTRAIPIKNTENFENRANTYSLGELWLAYSDGNQEGPLFSPRVR